MSINIHLKEDSKNTKIGKLALSTTTGAESCPNSCIHKQAGTCYAMTGPQSWHWSKVTKGTYKKNVSSNWSDLFQAIEKLHQGDKWRLNISGDLMPAGFDENGLDIANPEYIRGLVEANNKSKAKGYTYSHYSIKNKSNLNSFKYANKNGFTINTSNETYEAADDSFKKGLPTTLTRPSNEKIPARSPAGNKLVICPQQTSNGKITCESCKLCEIANREEIVIFLAHSARKNKLNKLIK